MHEILELEITQEDIDKALSAIANDEPRHLSCPVSQSAIRNKVEEFTASAGGCLFDGSYNVIWRGGEDCSDFQTQFDLHDEATPTKFIFTRKVH